MKPLMHYLPIKIGLRYFQAKRRSGFISFISSISLIGIALGVTALITILSVMNGFESNLKSRILGMASHATISSPSGNFSNWQPSLDTALKHPEVVGAAPYIEAQAMVTNAFGATGVLIRGINSALENSVSDIGKKTIEGTIKSLKPGKFNLLVGNEFAKEYGLSLGDKVNLIVPKINISIIGAIPRSKQFTITGIFKVDMYEYDSRMLVMNIKDAAKLYKMKDAVSGVRLKLKDLFKAKQVVADISSQLNRFLLVEDWTMQNENFFKAIKMEKLVMFIILSLIVAVASFNIVSTMVMVVTDKESEIAILRTLGMLPSSITKIFFTQGIIIGISGTMIGVACGVLLSLNIEIIVPWIEHILNVKFLDAEVYYISEVPSKLQSSDVIKVSFLSFFMSVLATWYPATKASKVQPAEALRYE